MALGQGPANRALAVTKSDTTVVNCRALYIGGTGDVVVTPLEGGNSVTFTTVPVGFFPVSCRHVMNATTATNIVALY